MWTEAHRARHDARLKAIVSINAVWKLARLAGHVPALAHRVDGLFTNDKFCLTRQGTLALSRRRSPLGADRQPPDAGAAVPRGSCPLGVGHEATALDGGAGPSQPPGSRAAVGPGLPAAPVDARRG